MEPSIIAFPGLKVVSPNRLGGTTRGARMGDAARRKRQRQLAHLTVRARFPMAETHFQDPNETVMVTIVRVSPRELDDDNFVAACKALRDGVADAFGMQDNDDRIDFWYEQLRGEPKEYAICFEIRFRGP